MPELTAFLANTSLAASGALFHCLLCRTAAKFKIADRGPKNGQLSLNKRLAIQSVCHYKRHYFFLFIFFLFSVIYPKYSSDPNFLPKIFFAKKIGGPNILWNHMFVGPKIYGTKKVFFGKIYGTTIWTTNSVWTRRLFKVQNFWGPKFFLPNFFFYQNCFSDPNIS